MKKAAVFVKSLVEYRMLLWNSFRRTVSTRAAKTSVSLLVAVLGLVALAVAYPRKAAFSLVEAPAKVIVFHLEKPEGGSTVNENRTEGKEEGSTVALTPERLTLTEKVRWVKGLRDTVLVQAWRQLRQPYSWGGTRPGGFDCSGLLYYSFRQAGLTLPRTAAEQARLGKHVPLDPAVMQAGDLIAFRTKGYVDHIGMYLGRGVYIHASGSANHVTLGKMNNQRDLIWRVPVEVRRIFLLPTAGQLAAAPARTGI